MPVASGVVNRFDSVMMILCGLLRELLTSRKPSPPAPPALLITTSGDFMRLYLVTIPWTVRAIWSAPPPVPAGTMNSTGRVGCHWAWAGSGVSAPAIPSPVRAPNAMRLVRDVMMPAPFSPTGFFVFVGLALRLPHRQQPRGKLAVSSIALFVQTPFLVRTASTQTVIHNARGNSIGKPPKRRVVTQTSDAAAQHEINVRGDGRRESSM